MRLVWVTVVALQILLNQPQSTSNT